MAATDPTDKIWTLIAEIETAMIVTHSGGQAMRARPMVARSHLDDNAVYFFTDANAPKDEEIERNSQVCLAFSDPKNNRYVSVTGTAEVLADQALAESLWKTADKAFWDSSRDPRIRIIRVSPERGEFWEGAGAISTFVAVLAAGAKGERPKLGDSKKVDM